MSGWAAVYGGMAATAAAITHQNKQDKSIPILGTTKEYVVFCNKELNLRVKFGEEFSDFLEGIRISESKILYKGIEFTFDYKGICT